MATSKKGGGGRDDFDSDLDFDIPDFGSFDDPELSQDNRKPLTTAVKSTAAGFGKSFTNAGRLRKTLTKALPREYEEPISKAFEIKDAATDLYNTGSQEVKKTINEGKRGLGRIVRNLDGALPKGLKDKLEKMLHVEEESGGYTASKEEAEQAAVDRAMNDVFAEDIKQRAQERKEDEAKDAIQKTLDKRRHRDMTGLLGSIDQSLLSLSTYQDKVLFNYQKKRLDLAVRGHFLQTEMLALQAKSFHEITESLGAITKNTGLPDYVKKAGKEHLAEHLRERVFDSIGNTIASRRRQYLSGVTKRANSMIKEKMSDFRDGMGQLLDVGEMMSSMGNSEFGPSLPELAGDVAGGWLGGRLQDSVAKRIRKRLVNSPVAMQRGNQLNRIATQFPQYIQHQLTRGKFADKVPDFIRDLARDDGPRTSIDVDRELDMDRGAPFSEKNSRSLNVVIPQLLSMIHSEIYMQRTGETGHRPVQYDYESGKFVSMSDRKMQALRTIVPDENRTLAKESLDSIFKTLDPTGKKLTEKERRAIGEELYAQNKSNRFFDKSYFEDPDFLAGVSGGEKFRKLLSGHLSDDLMGSKETAMSKSMSRIGQYSGDVTEVIEAMYRTGRGNELAELGLLDPATGKIDQVMLRRLELGQITLEELAGEKATASGRALKRNRSRAAKTSVPKVESKLPPSGLTDLSGLGILGLTGNISSRHFEEESKPKKRPTVIEPHIDWKGMAATFTEATEALTRLTSTGKFDSKDSNQITDAIKECCTKSQLEEIRDTLLRIEEKGLTSVVVNGDAVDRLGEIFNQKTAGARGFAGKAWDFTKRRAGNLWDFAKRGNQRSWDMSKTIIKNATDLTKFGIGKFSDFLSEKTEEFDLFIGRGKKPRLTAIKLKAGMYKDIATGKIIEKFEDITGDVLDLETDEIVLRAEEIKNAILKNFKTGKTKLAKLTTWGKSITRRMLEETNKSGKRALAMMGGVYGMAAEFGMKLYEHITDGPQDVYVKGDLETPVMYKYIMEAGRYFDRKTGSPITRPSQIKGPVIDEDGNIVVSNKAIKKGLVDKKGRPLVTGLAKLFQMGKDQISSIFSIGKNAWNKAKDMFSGVWEWIGGAKSPLTITTRRTNEILTDILELLIDRIPDRNIKGDTDGSGFADGSLEDIRKKRKEAKEKKEQDRSEKGPAGKKGLTGLAAVMDMMRKKKGAEEEEKSEDGDTYIFTGDGDGKGDKKGKNKPTKPAKPKGWFGRNWDKLKGAVTPKKGSFMSKAAGLGGRALGGLWSIGKTVAGGLAMGSLASATGLGVAGGALLSAGGSILGLMGSAIGLAASGVMAAISSPVVLGGALAAGAGYGLYKLWNWIFEKKPGPLGKVRFAQYGWTPKQIDKYGDILKIEMITKKAVVFTGNEAKIDSSKLDIKAMMDVFGLDPSNEDHAKKFLNWYANRFKVFYLQHLGLLKQMGVNIELHDIDDKLKDEQKLQYLKQCLFPGDAYTIPTSPYKKEVFLPASQGTAERLIEDAQKELEKKVDKGKKSIEERKAEIADKLRQDLGGEAKAVKALEEEKKKDANSTQGVPKRMGPESSIDVIQQARQASANARAAAAMGGTDYAQDPITGAPAGPDGRPMGGPGQPSAYTGGMPVSHPGNGTGGNINDLPVPSGNKSWLALKDVLLGAAKMAGVSPRTAATIAAIESDFDYTARPWSKAEKRYLSTAKGIYQFLDGTWKGMMDKYAGKYGISPDTTALDPRANALMGMEFLKDNTNFLRKNLGREPNATDIYMAHFMGPGGAVQFLNKNPNTIGASAFPDAAYANPSVYYHDGSKRQRPKTLGEIYQSFTTKLANRLKQHGVMDSELDGTAGPANAADASKAKTAESNESAVADPPKVSDPSAEAAAQSSSDPKANAPAMADLPQSVPAARSAPDGYQPKSLPDSVPEGMANPNRTLPERQRTDAAPAASSSAPASAPMAAPSSTSLPYIRENASLNQGDLPSILKEGVGHQKTMVDHLGTLVEKMGTVVELLDSLPSRMTEEAAAVSSGSSPAAKSTTVSAKPSQTLPKMNQSYQRSLTGRA